MKKTSTILTRAFLALAILSLAVLALGLTQAAAADFTADVTRSVNGQPQGGGKIFVRGSTMRMETVLGGARQVMITDTATNKAFLLQPRTMRYMEIPLDPANMGPEALKDGHADLGRWRVLGTETVEGWECEKRVFDFKDRGGQGEMTAWFALKLGHPIKSLVKDGENTLSTQYRNIRQGDVDPGLFAIPRGYEKLVMPAMPGAPGRKP